MLTVLTQCIFLQTTEVETWDFFISVCFFYLLRVRKRSCCGLTNLVWSPQTWLKFAPKSLQKYPVVSHCEKSMCRNKVLDCNHLAWQSSRLLLHHLTLPLLRWQSGHKHVIWMWYDMLCRHVNMVHMTHTCESISGLQKCKLPVSYPDNLAGLWFKHKVCNFCHKRSLNQNIEKYFFFYYVVK